MPSIARPLVSVIILNYNSERFVKECLRSVMKTDYRGLEVIVVDNASTDRSIETIREEFSTVRIVKNDRNLGYALGNNVGAENARGDVLVFLNVDTRVDPEWLRSLISKLEKDSTIGVVGPLILQARREDLVDSCGNSLDWFGISRVMDHDALYREMNLVEREVFSVSGACLAVRREVFAKLKGFDSDFFMLFEEDDFCWRAWLAGYSISLQPNSIICHEGAAIRRRRGDYFSLYLSRRNRMVSILKNYQLRNVVRFFPFTLILLLLIGCLSSYSVVYFRAYFSAVSWVIHNFSLVLRKRKSTQRMRRVSDAELIKKGIIRKPSYRDWIASGF